MARYVLKRLFTSIILLFLLIFLVFLMLDLLPGDSLTALLGAEAGTEDIAALRERAGSASLFFRYFSYISSFFSGNLGSSASGGESVSKLIKAYATPTLELSFLSLLLTIGISFGFTYLFVRRKGQISAFFYSLISLFSQAVPAFALAFLLMLLFSLKIPVFPVAGYDPTRPVYSLFLPALSLSLAHSGFIIRNLKKGFEREEAQGYVASALARGESLPSVIICEMFIALEGESVTLFSQSLIAFLTSSAAVEYVFSIPGWGLLAVQSVSRRDVLTLTALILIFCVVSILFTLISDIAVKAINSRRRAGE